MRNNDFGKSFELYDKFDNFLLWKLNSAYPVFVSECINSKHLAVSFLIVF